MTHPWRLNSELRPPIARSARIEQLKADKVYKTLNYLDSPQSARVQMEGRGEVLILSSNNYLGLSRRAVGDPGGNRRAEEIRRRHGERAIHLRHVHDSPRARGGARAVRRNASRRCRSLRRGTRTKAFTGTIAQEGDFVISDALNHASIIDSMRLAKAISKCTTGVYKHARHGRSARASSCEAQGAKRRIIWTDGVFSMEGAIAKLPDILQIARDHDAIVVDGRLSRDGRARQDRSRHGRAFRRARRGGRHHVDARQSARRRGGRIRRGIGMRSATISRSARVHSSSRTRCRRRSRRARCRRCGISRRIRSASRSCARTRSISASRSPRPGSSRLPGETPIVPIIVGETAAAIQMSDMLLDEGVFVTGFGFPVVPQGQARVRCQISARHTRATIWTRRFAAFKKVGMKLGIIR